MLQQSQKVTVKVDGYTRFCLTAIAILLTVLVIGLWADGVRPLGEARAAEKFLDTGAQRQEMVAAQERVNAKLTELVELLKSGQAKVQIVADARKPQLEGEKDADAAAPGQR